MLLHVLQYGHIYRIHIANVVVVRGVENEHRGGAIFVAECVLALEAALSDSRGSGLT